MDALEKLGYTKISVGLYQKDLGDKKEVVDISIGMGINHFTYVDDISDNDPCIAITQAVCDAVVQCIYAQRAIDKEEK